MELHAKELRQLNRNSSMGMKLEYVPPSHRDGKIVIQIVEEDVSMLNEHWATALIGYVLGDAPYEKSMENYVEFVWDFVTKPQILYHKDGYYVFRFATIEKRDLVMQAGPYSYHNKLLILQNWERDFRFDPKCITTIPLWTHFPSLPAGYWTADALSKVVSAVGLPMYTEKFTAELNKISYARVLKLTLLSLWWRVLRLELLPEPGSRKFCMNGDQSSVVNVCILVMISLNAGEPTRRILKMLNLKFLKEEIGTEGKG